MEIRWASSRYFYMIDNGDFHDEYVFVIFMMMNAMVIFIVIARGFSLDGLWKIPIENG